MIMEVAEARLCCMVRDLIDAAEAEAGAEAGANRTSGLVGVGGLSLRLGRQLSFWKLDTRSKSN